MNRRIATLATIAIAAFGLTACSGAPSASVAPTGADTTPATSASAPSTPAAPETSASAQTLAEACLEPNAKLIEASAELAKVSAALSQNGGKDPKQAVKALSATADYFGKLAESSSNADVRKALTGIQKGYAKYSDLYAKVVIKKDYAAAADAAKILAELQKSMTAFQTLCAA